MKRLIILSLSALIFAMPVVKAADSPALRAAQMSGDYVRAQKIVLAELRRLEAQRPQNQKRIIRVLGQLSRLSSILNDLPAAESYEQRALALASRQQGLHPLDLIDLRHQIGLLQNSQGKIAPVPAQKLEQAHESFQTELAAREKLFGMHSAQNIHTWRDIAENLETQRRCSEAYQARMKEFALLRTIYGEEHFAMANIYMDLGRLSYKMEKYSQAVAQYGVALRLLTKHDAVANCLMIREAEREIAKASGKMAMANTRMNWL